MNNRARAVREDRVSDGCSERCELFLLTGGLLLGPAGVRQKRTRTGTWEREAGCVHS